MTKGREHADNRVVRPGFHDRVYDRVCQVPAGRVSTYADIAGSLGARSVARHVGHALAALPAQRDEVPWHRIVNSRGYLSPRKGRMFSPQQRALLRAEGVKVDASGRVQEFREVLYRPGPR